MLITLVCWSCGKSLEVEVVSPPQFGIDLAMIANKAGWLGCVDHAAQSRPGLLR
jgi:hypothetical protein